MSNSLATVLFIWIVLAMLFPQTGGRTAHLIFNSLKAGWEQVQP